MGCLHSKETNTSNSQVEGYLKEESLKSLTNFKILLLGAGESGKSTVVKQLKVIHKVALDEQEINNYKVTLHNNTLTSMQTFLEAAKNFGYTFSNEEEKNLANKLDQFCSGTELKMMTPEIGNIVVKLSNSECIKKTFKRRNEFWNLDASDYYFENAIRFSKSDFVPSEEDCIMARVRTTGIVVTEFDEGPAHFCVVDVAGQRSERKKWIHCFDDVRALIFVVSLAGYNQVLFEDSSHNRMSEALNLFQQISNNPLFINTPIFLFLNKKDLFEKMLEEYDLKKCFPEYTGGSDIKLALKFVSNEFEKRIEEDNRKNLHIYYVAARFKKDIKYSWEELKNVLLEQNKKVVKEAEKKRKKEISKVCIYRLRLLKVNKM